MQKMSWEEWVTFKFEIETFEGIDREFNDPEKAEIYRQGIRYTTIFQ